MIQCKQCGSSNLDNSRFCAFCGAPFTPQQPSTAAQARDKRFPRMISLQGGNFFMGQKAASRLVALSAFSLSETPITQLQYQYVMAKQPSKLLGDLHPVESVNWCEAVIYCNNLSAMMNLQPCYSIGNSTDLASFDTSSAVWKRIACNFLASGFRLPTEAEWEFAARGGVNQENTLFAGSNDINAVAWYGENSNVSSHDVGQKAPNSLGLYDMCGNVAEWCWDYLGEITSQPAQNPRGPNIGDLHVKRGGSWLDDGEQCTVFYRSGSAPTGKSSSLGFRICRSF